MTPFEKFCPVIKIKTAGDDKNLAESNGKPQSVQANGCVDNPSESLKIAYTALSLETINYFLQHL
jgi:hypothetical protein